MLLYFSKGFLLGGPAAAQPGPFQAYLLSQTMQNGWRRTFLAAFAPLISDGPIVCFVLFILSRLPEDFLSGLQIVGGFFLLFLARNAFLIFKSNNFQQPVISSAASRQSLLEAALMNALSPGPYLFWATIAGPILLASWQESPAHSLGFLMGFYGTLIGGFVGFITLFAVARHIDPQFSRVLSAVSACILLGFGLFQLWQGSAALLN